MAAAKRQCGIGDDDLNEDLKRWIRSARAKVEEDTSVACYTGTFTWKLTDFPPGDFIEIPLRPVTSITSIVYTATDGTSTTWSSSEYSLDTASVAPLVKLGYGYVWPTVRGDINGITITFVAGYSSVAVLPSKIRDAVLLDVHASYLTMQEKDSAPQERGADRLIRHIGRPVYA